MRDISVDQVGTAIRQALLTVPVAP
jgi:hypothetical protein